MQHPKCLQVITIGSNPEDIGTLRESVKHHYQAHASKWRDKEGFTANDLFCPPINIIDLDNADWMQQLSRKEV